MWELISSVFGKYGRVSKTPARDRIGFGWAVYSYLDRSFDFLLAKRVHLEDELLSDESQFLSFLSGYVDAEGNLRISEDDGEVAVSFRINSEDEGILRGIRSSLSSMGYHVYFGLQKKRGVYPDRIYQKNLWGLGMFRKREVTELLGRLSLRHPEKVRWAKLIMASRGRHWDSMKEEVSECRNSIKAGVLSFRLEAERLYVANHHSITAVQTRPSS